MTQSTTEIMRVLEEISSGVCNSVSPGVVEVCLRNTTGVTSVEVTVSGVPNNSLTVGDTVYDNVVQLGQTDFTRTRRTSTQATDDSVLSRHVGELQHHTAHIAHLTFQVLNLLLCQGLRSRSVNGVQASHSRELAVESRHNTVLRGLQDLLLDLLLSRTLSSRLCFQALCSSLLLVLRDVKHVAVSDQLFLRSLYFGFLELTLLLAQVETLTGGLLLLLFVFFGLLGLFLGLGFRLVLFLSVQLPDSFQLCNLLLGLFEKGFEHKVGTYAFLYWLLGRLPGFLAEGEPLTGLGHCKLSVSDVFRRIETGPIFFRAIH